MILAIMYKDEILEYIREIPAEKLRISEERKGQLLKDPIFIDRVWMKYQKLVQDYSVDPEEARADILKEFFDVEISDNEHECGEMSSEDVSISIKQLEEMFAHYISRKRYKQQYASSSQNSLWAAGECSEAEKWLGLFGVDCSYEYTQRLVDHPEITPKVRFLQEGKSVLSSEIEEEKVEEPGPWIITDPVCFQICRKVGDGKYELYQINALVNQRYNVSHQVIYVSGINVKDVLDCYGYDSLDDLKETYGEEWEQILAECDFELQCSNMENIVAWEVTYEATINRICLMSGFCV